jgi:hypothetical protein
MEISSSQAGGAVQMALQAMLLNQMKVQGACAVNLIAAALPPAGSVNLPSQGTQIDALA